MMLDVLFRKSAFWILDKIKGGSIRRQYNQIKDFYFNGIDEDVLEENIERLLTHAKMTTKYYKNYDNLMKINDFPVVNKMTYIENYDDFISEVYSEKKLHTMSTSGSTGTPFTILQDMRKRNRVLAEVVFYGEICGYDIGMKQAFFRIWNEKVKKSKLQAYKQNLEMIDISNLSDERLKEIKEIIINKKVKSILSYASTLDVFSNYLESVDNDKFYVTSIISSSELLQEHTRNKLKNIFKCNVISRYSNQENGILAQECIEKNEFHLNTSSYYFEILKLDKDEPAEEGEIGRIVVTDLFNYAMPIIRYDTGDTGSIISETLNGRKKMVLKDLFGRRVDIIYNTMGEMISPHVITNNMWGCEGIKQFKFIQYGKKNYKIIINCIDNNIFNGDYIINKFKSIMGKDAEFTLELVNEIPILESGKRKYIENLME